MKNDIFIVGLDQFNLSILQSMQNIEAYDFHPLLTYPDIRLRDDFPVREFLDGARRTLEKSEHEPDAIVGYWDFPVTSLVPILCRERGLIAPTLESVFKCEHKYWSRLEQQKVVPECVPAFQRVDPFAKNSSDTIRLEYPFWIKPVKSFHSYLSFFVENQNQLEDALGSMRRNIQTLQEPFEYLLSQADVPQDIARGGFCLAEKSIPGRQCTVSGYVYRGETVIYGVVDSLIQSGTGSSFSRFQYPSPLPEKVQQRMADLSRSYITHIGYEDAPFNIEYFYDEHTDTLSLLEANPRISQSHSMVYQLVDGETNHLVMLELALGRDPKFPHRQGRFPMAAKCFFRHVGDGVVSRVPGKGELDQVREIAPEAMVKIDVTTGDRLSTLRHQDSFSYELGYVFLGGENEEEITEKFERIEETLGFAFEEVNL
ncbi:MAG: acetyl-CoA carboxylase biotin carboxylase subunit family protein [Desulfovibrionales bacterium]